MAIVELPIFNPLPDEDDISSTFIDSAPEIARYEGRLSSILSRHAFEITEYEVVGYNYTRYALKISSPISLAEIKQLRYKIEEAKNDGLYFVSDKEKDFPLIQILLYKTRIVITEDKELLANFDSYREVSNIHLLLKQAKEDNWVVFPLYSPSSKWIRGGGEGEDKKESKGEGESEVISRWKLVPVDEKLSIYRMLDRSSAANNYLQDRENIIIIPNVSHEKRYAISKGIERLGKFNYRFSRDALLIKLSNYDDYSQIISLVKDSSPVVLDSISTSTFPSSPSPLGKSKEVSVKVEEGKFTTYTAHKW